MGISLKHKQWEIGTMLDINNLKDLELKKRHETRTFTLNDEKRLKNKMKKIILNETSFFHLEVWLLKGKRVWNKEKVGQVTVAKPGYKATFRKK